MRLFSRIRDLFTDFLFPKSQKILELEALSADYLLEILPKADNFSDEEVFALFDYSHTLVKEIVWQVKYDGNRAIAGKLGTILYDHLVDWLSDKEIFENLKRPILMPIPISDKRRYERGWNQSELLLEAISRCDSAKIFKYLPRQLVKTYHTESQTKTSSKTERLENLKNSMKVASPPSVAGRCVIVIDDVTTTGSTFVEARRALQEAGAKKIFCVAIAH